MKTAAVAGTAPFLSCLPWLPTWFPELGPPTSLPRSSEDEGTARRLWEMPALNSLRRRCKPLTRTSSIPLSLKMIYFLFFFLFFPFFFWTRRAVGSLPLSYSPTTPFPAPFLTFCVPGSPYHACRVHEPRAAAINLEISSVRITVICTSHCEPGFLLPSTKQIVSWHSPLASSGLPILEGSMFSTRKASSTQPKTGSTKEHAFQRDHGEGWPMLYNSF